MRQETLKINYQHVRNKISAMCDSLARPLPRFLAVTKGRKTQDIATLASFGQCDFGENFLPELEDKYQALVEKGLNWIYLGILQSNKIKAIVSLCCEIHSVASLKHARYINRYAHEYGKQRYPVYLAVNISKEPQKHGISPEQVVTLADEVVRTCENLSLEGIMAIPPARYCDASYQHLPEPYQQLQQLKAHCGNKKLSLGMSADLRLALMAGTDCVRVGRALFRESVSISEH